MDSKSEKVNRPSEWTVADVTRLIKELIEGEPELSAIWIKGEASNIRLAGSGHLYFTLKDEHSELRCVYFGFGRRKKKPPAEGDALLVHGDVRVYEKRGEYQIVCDDLIKAGVGDLAARFEALKNKLHSEGLFDEIRKALLPQVPRKIAICTGIATAALQDVLNILSRRAPYLDAVVFPCSVQGDAAPAEIIAALQAADTCPGIETILLVRGGGSIEDLWCFNDETLARVIADLERPVITGVGHEIDFTIVDFVADKRAPTPSAAAELVAPDAADLRGGVDNHSARMLRAWSGKMDGAQASLARLFDTRLIRDVTGTLDNDAQMVDSLGEQLATQAAELAGLGVEAGYDERLERMAAVLTRELEHQAHVMPRLEDDLLRSGRQSMDNLVAQLKAQHAQLSGLDPSAPKKLGFALVWNEAGELVRNPDQVASGEKMRVEVRDGEMWGKRE